MKKAKKLTVVSNKPMPLKVGDQVRGRDGSIGEIESIHYHYQIAVVNWKKDKNGSEINITSHAHMKYLTKNSLYNSCKNR